MTINTEEDIFIVGKELLKKGFGLASIEFNIPMKPEMIFRLASMTKQFTAVSILMLEEKGKLSVKDDIRKYLPDYPTHGEIITIENLLTHTSGIPSFTSFENINEIERKIRALVAKPGLDGHDRGAKVVARAMRDAGMEVIYTGLHQTPEMIVNAAVQEDVDVVAMSILSGAHMTMFPRVLELMKDAGLTDVIVTGGGIIPQEDMDELVAMGVDRLFGPGSDTREIAKYIEEAVSAKRG